MLGDDPHDAPILFRDLKDNDYPNKEFYKDFEKAPRWREYSLVDYHSKGLVIIMDERFAYINTERTAYDVFKSVSLLDRQSDDDETRQDIFNKRQLAEDYWSFFPRTCQGKYIKVGIVPFDAIQVIDEKGDKMHPFTHIYIDFDRVKGPVSRIYKCIKVGEEEINIANLNKIDKIPSELPNIKLGKIHKLEEVLSKKSPQVSIQHKWLHTLYSNDNKYGFLKEKDVIELTDNHSSKYVDEQDSKYFFAVTSIGKVTIDYTLKEHEPLRWNIEEQTGQKPKDKEVFNTYELKKIHKWQLDNSH